MTEPTTPLDAAHPALLDLREDGTPILPARPVPGTEPSAPPSDLPGAEPLARPVMLDLPAGMSADPIVHDWGPAPLRPRTTSTGSLGPVAAGLGVFLLGWLALSAMGFVSDQFDRSDASRWTAAAVLAAGLLGVLWGVHREVRAYRRLCHVDALRALLRDDDGPVQPARALALEWLDALAGLPGVTDARQAALTAPDIPLLRAGLRRHLSEPLRLVTRRAGDRAALEGGALVAISPSPALDGFLAGLRGLALLRQVAALHGMRPGGAVTFALLRRLLRTATSTAGLDLLGQSLADSALAHLPGLRHLAAAIPGATVAALRLRRLADVTAKACSPLEIG